MRQRRRPPSPSGFSLIEALLSLFTTLALVALVLQSGRIVGSVYDVESRRAENSAIVTWAFDEIAGELANAGYGLGDGVSPLRPFLLEDRTPTSERITLFSNPEALRGVLLEELGLAYDPVSVAGAGHFAAGDRVLLTNPGGGSEAAEIVTAEAGRLSFRSLETPDGNLRGAYLPDRQAKVLQIREVRFRLQQDPSGEGSLLIKEIVGQKPRLLARGISMLQFDYLDGGAQSIAPAQLRLGHHAAAAVRIRLHVLSDGSGSPSPALTTAVALGRHSATLIFVKRQ